MRVDLVLTGFDEVVTLEAGSVPRIGKEMQELSRIDRGALAIARGRVAWTGKASLLRAEVTLRKGGRVHEYPGGTALPGFVDPHTHLVFAGSREEEVAQKVVGKSYLEIARGGGGLFKTVRETREAPEEELWAQARFRLQRMVRWGTTSLEVKSGYGLSLDSEMKLLRTIRRLSTPGGPRIVPTFLGAHAFPPEFRRKTEEYVRDLVSRQIPAVARSGLARFCDVFCEVGFFSPADSERILRAATQEGLKAKIHADEFTDRGGAEVAARVGAVSADHLLETGARGRRALAEAGVTAVLLPLTPFASLSRRSSPGREMVDEGVPVAIGTDLSPNSWVESMPLVIAHAVYGARLTPEEAVTAATVNAAHAIGLTDAGRLSPGSPADITVFDLPGVEHLSYRPGALPPVAVYLRGKKVAATRLGALPPRPKGAGGTP